MKDKGELDGLVTSSIGVPVRCVAIDPKGKRVAVTSECVHQWPCQGILFYTDVLMWDVSELSVKVVDMEDIIRVCVLDGHTRGVRKATWHPSAPLVVRVLNIHGFRTLNLSWQTTCGADGRIIAWDVSEDKPKIEKILEGVIPEVTQPE